MKISEIMKFPTTIDNNHESLYRCYHILDKVKFWLKETWGRESILELIEELEGGKE